MKYGVIIRNVTDLWSEPKFNSERRSQLLYNETVTITQKRAGYLRVYQNDGYTGWVDKRAINIVSNNAWQKYKRKLNFNVTSKTAAIKSNNKQSDKFPAFLFYGTKLAVKRKSGNHRTVETITGESFKILSGNCENTDIVHNSRKDSSIIIRDARRFLGVPYLWGGSTPFGYDCSGMVQTLYARAGINLPRDSKDQRKAGTRIDKEDIKKGDLLFFPGHVAIALDKGKIIHSSLAEGGVAINSLTPDSANFRKDLYSSFLEVRRVLK